MILVGATDNDKFLVFHLGDDTTGQVLFSAKLSPERVDSVILQMQVIQQNLDRTPEPKLDGDGTTSS